MKTTVEFLNAVRARHRLTSDYKLARFLAVTDTTIGNYRKGRSMMDEAMCLKIAAALDLDPGDVLVAIAIEREKRVEVKTAWQRVAKRLAASVGAALLYITVSTAPNAPSAVAGPIYTYASKRLRWLTRWSLQALARLALALGLTLELAACASGGPWSAADVGREALYQGLLTVDCAQTLYGASHPDQFAETNRFLPEHPSKGRINATCLATGAGHYTISRWLHGDGRTAWQGVTIGIEAWAVDTNRMVGAKIEF